jgi:hypothetical protein
MDWPLSNSDFQSLMNFILPERFADSLDSLRAIFKVKGDHKVTLLAQERVSRAKKMMTPFVLRRRKDQVSYPADHLKLLLIVRCTGPERSPKEVRAHRMVRHDISAEENLSRHNATFSQDRVGNQRIGYP